MGVADDLSAMFADSDLAVAVECRHGGRLYRTTGFAGVSDTLETADGLQVGVRRATVNVAAGSLGEPPVDALLVVGGKRHRLLALLVGAGDGATQVVVLGPAADV